jgi:pimeloyl-ACP methyl ester carboxylesterase
MTNTIPSHTIQGSGKTTIFLLHGAYGDGRYFSELAKQLCQFNYRVVVWDCPGYGQSARLPEATIEYFAEAAIRLVEHTKTETNVLLGHSMGALIGPRVATLSDHLDALILSAGSKGFVARPPEDQARYLQERLAPIEQGMSVSEYALPLIRHMMADGASGQLVDHVVDVILDMKTQTFADSIKAISTYDSRPSLNAITIPTLLIAGAEDPACTAAGMREMSQMIADSEFHILDGSGHYGFAERPREYLSIVLGFLQSRFGIEQ